MQYYNLSLRDVFEVMKAAMVEQAPDVGQDHHGQDLFCVDAEDSVVTALDRRYKFPARALLDMDRQWHFFGKPDYYMSLLSREPNDRRYEHLISVDIDQPVKELSEGIEEITRELALRMYQDPDEFVAYIEGQLEEAAAERQECSM